MIISDKGMVRMEGSRNHILADLSAAVHGLHEVLTEKIGEEESKKVIMEAVEDAFKSAEELDAEIEKLEKAMEDKKVEVTEALFRLLFERGI